MSRKTLWCVALAFSLTLAACGGTSTETTTTEDAGTPPGSTGAPVATTTPSSTTQAPATTVAPPASTTQAPDATQTPPVVTAEVAALRAALTETTEVTSAQMEGTMIITGAEGVPSDGPMTMTFAGAFDNATGDFAMNIDLGEMLGSLAGDSGAGLPPEMAAAFTAIEMRQVDDVAYVRFGLINLFLGVDTDWLAMPAEDADSVSDFTGFVPSNPAELAAAWGGSDVTVEDLGRETVRGVSTTHYRVTADVAALIERGDQEALDALEAQGPVPLDEMTGDFWFDDDGLLYRYQTDIEGADVEAPAGEGFEAMTITFEIWGYNEPITVEVPDAADVTHVDDLDIDGLFGGF